MRRTLRVGKYGMLFYVNIQCTKFKYLSTTSVLKISDSKSYYNVSVEKHTTITMYSICNIMDEVTQLHIIVLHI